MNRFVDVTPAGGRELRDILFEHGVEFPCGGESLCGGCRVRVLSGDIPVTPEMRQALTESELAEGWRLSCRAHIDRPVRLAVEQWSAPVLSDVAAVAFEPSEGFGAVIDLGTTTLVVQLVNLLTGEVEDTRTALNPQARHGADIMTRIQFALKNPGKLTAIIRESLGAMIAEVRGARAIREILIVGNTAMHHLFCGESVEPLSAVPFRPIAAGSRSFESGDLGWQAPGAAIHFVGCVGGFVGSDVLAGMVATGFAQSDRERVLIDLGTNGEIAVGNRHRVRCASTAAGPAFEAGKIKMGMRAGRGAIDRVAVNAGSLVCHVIGGTAATGLCGSGLVDAAAAGLDLGLIEPRGRLSNSVKQLHLEGNVALFQSDVRELQLAKGAVAAGLNMLSGGRATLEFHLAGAFGNYVREESARRIGLLPEWAGQVHAAGNTALRGTRMLLLAPSRRAALLAGLLGVTEHVELAADPGFQDEFVDCMTFPDQAQRLA